MISLIKEATGILTTMKDEDTVKATAPKLKKIGTKRQDLMKRFFAVGSKLSKEEQTALFEKYGKEIKETEAKYKTEKKRVEKLPGGKDAVRVLESRGDSKEKDKKKDEKEEKKKG